MSQQILHRPQVCPTLEQMRGLATEELVTGQQDAREELFKLRFALDTESVENTRQTRELRKRVARIKTVIRQREIADAKSAGKES